MKKLLLSSLLIIMISMIGAQSYFFDMRVGDFGCITRLVFEFTGKVNYTSLENVNNLEINITSLNESKIQLPLEESKNILEIHLTESSNTAKLNFDFIFPIETNSYAYYKENKNYIIVFDIYDKDYLTDKEKGLTTLLFKGQKFSLEKIRSEIEDFSAKYPNDDLVNFYLARLFSTEKDMKSKAIDYYSRIHPSSSFYFTATAYISNLEKNKFPTEEIKPDFLAKNELIVSTSDSLANQAKENISNKIIDNKTTNKEEKKKINIEDNTKDKASTKNNLQQNDKNDIKINTLMLTIMIVSILTVLFQFFKNLKKNIMIKELNAKLENKEYELKALANKLEKGIIENSKTKDRMIIKLYNNGWKAEDIAQELNTPLEIINATINKEGRL